MNDRTPWAAAGELALIQRVAERLPALPAETPLANLRDQLRYIIKQGVTDLVEMDFRTQFLPPDPERLLQLHFADFIFAEFPRKPQILVVTL